MWTSEYSRVDEFRREEPLLLAVLKAMPAAALITLAMWALYVFAWAIGGGV